MIVEMHIGSLAVLIAATALFLISSIAKDVLARKADRMRTKLIDAQRDCLNTAEQRIAELDVALERVERRAKALERSAKTLRVQRDEWKTLFFNERRTRDTDDKGE